MTIKRSRWMIIVDKEYILCGAHRQFRFVHYTKLVDANVITYNSKKMAEYIFRRHNLYRDDLNWEAVEIEETLNNPFYRFKGAKIQRCTYCQLHIPLFQSYEDDSKMVIEYPQNLRYYDKDGNYVGVKIRYCPCCGRELV